MRGGFLLAASALLMAQPIIAGEEPPPIEGDFRIGSTGIHCVRAPCPWRGITRIGDDGRPDGWPLWSGEEAPAIKSEPDTQRRIAASWREQGCLTVRGRFEKGELTVHRILGDC